MPRHRKIISAVVFLNIVGLVYVAYYHAAWLEVAVGWMNLPQPGLMWMLDAARIFQMFALAIASIQLADTLADHKPRRWGYWLTLIPFPIAFFYFYSQISTVQSEVIPRLGFVVINLAIGAIILSFSALLGFLRTRIKK